MELLKELFDYQRFEENPGLEVLINKVYEKYLDNSRGAVAGVPPKRGSQGRDRWNIRGDMREGQ